MSDFVRWNAFKAGSRQAFSEIYQSEASYLYKYGYTICNDGALIRDSLQDMFVRLWDRREHIGPTDHIRKYLTIVFKRDLIKRMKQKGIIVFTEDIPETADEPIATSTNQQLLTRLTKHIRNLTPKQHQLIKLKYYDCLDYQSICTVMGIKYQSARNLHAEAIKKLQRAFDKGTIQYKMDKSSYSSKKEC